MSDDTEKPSRERPARRRPRRAPRKAAAAAEPAAETGASEAAAGENAAAEAGALVPGALTVVGLGASAGGMRAVRELLAALPVPCPLALVVVQHLDPEHESILPSLLGDVTAIPVVHAEEGMPLLANRVHVIPPNVHLELADHHLHLVERPADARRYRPVDHFFASLALTYGSRAIAVVLSGTASDGAQGLREVKAAGGIAMAQDPETATFDGMPRAAVATGVVDRVLSPADLAAELARIGEHPYLRRAEVRRAGSEIDLGEDKLRRILALLRAATGVDFSQYKSQTIERRLQRRMVLNRITDVDRYVRFLQATPDEAEALFNDILIRVTRFFREPASYQLLAERVFPEVLARRQGDEPLRIWVAGCATGEEVYSVGITLLETMGDGSREVPVQIFGTDLSEDAVTIARSGVYPETVAADVSPERLRRFFTRLDGRYRVIKAVREMCIFARQDITSDPPFSHLDLIVCRNVLIYLDPALQKRVLGIFHYGLNPDGFLLLGAAETVGHQADLFAAVDRRHRLFVKKGSRGGGLLLPRRGGPAARPHRLPEPPEALQAEALAGRRLDLLLLNRFAPPAVLVDAEFHVVQSRGRTSRFIELPQGEMTLDLLKMAREGLVHPLRAALQEAQREGHTVRRDGVRLHLAGDTATVNLEVVPVSLGAQERHLLVLFEEPPREAAGPAEDGVAEEPERMQQLQQELDASREYMQAMIQDLEAANEELQSANEEILSANEELQSTNEELDTAKEELQSTNEELNTLNDELHSRNEELARVNSDLVNLLGSVQISIVIVDTQLKVRRFTPSAERTLNLIATDLGRPIRHIKPEIECPDLEELIGRVIDEVSVIQRDVRDRQGRWYSLRIRPYKSLDNRIEGAVLALVDVDDLKQQEVELSRSRETAEAVIDGIRAPLVVLDAERRVVRTNRAFRQAIDVAGGEVEGVPLFELAGGRLDRPPLRRLLDRELPAARPLEVRLDPGELPLPAGRGVLLNARRIPGRQESGEVLLIFEEVCDGPADEPRAETS